MKSKYLLSLEWPKLYAKLLGDKSESFANSFYRRIWFWIHHEIMHKQHTILVSELLTPPNHHHTRLSLSVLAKLVTLDKLPIWSHPRSGFDLITTLRWLRPILFNRISSTKHRLRPVSVRIDTFITLAHTRTNLYLIVLPIKILYLKVCNDHIFFLRWH